MASSPLAFTEFFADLPDPRVARTRLHRLDDILVIAVCAVLCGADSFEEIEEFGHAKEPWLKRFLTLPHGIPSHDTFNRVFAALDRKAFAERFARWMASVGQAVGWKVVAIDGKACRSAPADTFSGCLHVVSAWASDSGLSLAQVAVEDGSHEIATIPEVLTVLDLQGALVTIDAAGCQKAIARQIREQKGDYVLAVKGNQPSLLDAVGQVFATACGTDFTQVEHDGHAEEDHQHGRREERYTVVIRDPVGLPAEWPDVAAVVQVNREREVHGKRTSTTHYYVTSARLDAARLASVIRGHWGIENGLHWELDVVFGEDRNRTRDRNAGANLGVVRRVAVSLLKQDPKRGGLHGKRLKAALNEEYLEQVLQGFKAN